MAKRRTTRDVSSDEICNEMRGYRRRNNNHEEGLSTVSQQRGRQHQRRLNYDPTQGNVASNIGRNLRKKRSSQY
ncbi:hypothetical protein IGI04_003457 [Brassica rapa subsp. trilocularis]|uniref:Uncharacterized protein n=1 Tax=Brassica rapa subsp. trilocularis TaxID=1813537 RepID=A0ABQ7NYF7_BRACM|nr:hypothetical protein IGI04_003457 [Brassica rapa subsp. trilocularis]